MAGQGSARISRSRLPGGTFQHGDFHTTDCECQKSRPAGGTYFRVVRVVPLLYLLIGYMWLFIHRPFEIWPVLGEVRLEFVYIIIVLIAWAFYPQKRWLPNKLHAAFFAFAVAVVMCWLASPWKTDYSDLLVENYFKRVLFAILLVTVIHDKQDLRLFMRAFLVIMAIYMAHSLKEFLFNNRHVYRMDIPRMVGIDSTMNDPNAFAGSILCTLPFLPLFRLGARLGRIGGA